MLMNLNQIPNMSLNEIANACNTSNPSIIRFCREIGYEGLSDFKYDVLNYLDEVHDKVLRINVPVKVNGTSEQFQNTLKCWINNQTNVTYEAISKIDPCKIQAIANDIVNHKDVYVYGIGVSEVIGEYFRIQLARSSKMIICLPPKNEFVINSTKEDTLSIIITQRGRFLYHNTVRNEPFLEQINKCSNKVWCISADEENIKVIPNHILVSLKEEQVEIDTIVFIDLMQIIGQCVTDLLDKN